MGRAVAASPTLKGAFALLLALSVGGKIIAADRSHPGVEPTAAGALADDVAAFFDRHGFRVDEDRGTFELPSVRAVAGECELLAVIAAPEGFHRDIIRRAASERDRVFFVFDAVTYPDQPLWLTWTHHQWHVLNRRVGRSLPNRPVLGITASPTCDLRGLPWREVAELP